MVINRNSSIPLYIQLKNDLERDIRDGEFKDGEKMPSEKELCERFSVSRVTVRQALKELESKGIIYTTQGKGTFVRRPMLGNGLFNISSFSETLARRGLSGFTKVLSYQMSSCPKRVLEKFGLDERNHMLNLNLLGYAEMDPVVYYRSFYQKNLGEQMVEAALRLEQDKQAFSSYDLYPAIGTDLTRIEQSITAVEADESIATILKVGIGTALLVLESLYFGANGLPVEYKMAYYRADRYSFTLQREVGNVRLM